MSSDTLVAKLVSMCLLGGISLFLGLIPIKISKVLSWDSESPRSQLVLSSLACFGAGVILTTTVTHMMPEVGHFIRYNIEHGVQEDTGMPLAEILVLLGFFMIYIVEELVHHGVEWYRKRLVEQNKGGSGSATAAENGKQEQNGEAHRDGHGHDHDHGGELMDIMAAEKEKAFQVGSFTFVNSFIASTCGN